MGSDLENVSMSSRLSQETLMATLVTQSLAPGPWAPKFAIPALVDKRSSNGLRKGGGSDSDTARLNTWAVFKGILTIYLNYMHF